jgi:hypothetical protein
MVGADGRSRVYLWFVPADARGRWVADLPEFGGRWQFDIAQKFQILDVDARVGTSTGGSVMVVRGARLRGEEIRLAVSGVVGGRAYNVLFTGKVAEGRIEGNARFSDGERQKTIPWKAAR